MLCWLPAILILAAHRQFADIMQHHFASSIGHGSLSYLDAYLAPLAPYLSREDVTDLFINVPGEVWTETLDGTIEHHVMPELTEVELWRLARQIAAASHQGISREYPLLSATLAGDLRVQIVAPPAARRGPIFAFRKHLTPDMTLADYLAGEAFCETRHKRASSSAERLPEPLLAEPSDKARFLRELVQAGRNILISGGTSSGKTTFLNALLKEVPASQRLVLIEDTPEVIVSQPNVAAMLASKGGLAEARASADDLLQAALRLRPDRIILGEVRGGEAYTFLRAVNTGHPGSMTTIHADSAEGALEQLALIVLQTGTQLRREDIIHYARSTIHAVVQLERRGGQRRISEILLTR